MFHFEDPPLIAAPLLSLMSPVHRFHGGLAVTWCVRVEDPYVKKCTLVFVPPESLCTHVQSRPILGVRSPVLELFSRECLEIRLHSNVVAYLCEEVSSDVSHVIMSE